MFDNVVFSERISELFKIIQMFLSHGNNFVRKKTAT